MFKKHVLTLISVKITNGNDSFKLSKQNESVVLNRIEELKARFHMQTEGTMYKNDCFSLLYLSMTKNPTLVNILR